MVHWVGEEQGWCVAGLSPTLAPKRKPTKFQQEMMKSVEDLSAQLEMMSKQFARFQNMIRGMLDKLDGLESWRSTMDKSLGSLLQKTDDVVTQVDQTTSRLQALEAPPPPPPPPPPPLPPPMMFQTTFHRTMDSSSSTLQPGHQFHPWPMIPPHRP